MAVGSNSRGGCHGRRPPHRQYLPHAAIAEIRGISMGETAHSERVVDQFTRQAPAFSRAPMITDDTVLRMIVNSAGAGPTDTVLDVACGPGIVICAFSPHVGHASIDFTPAML